MANPTKGLSRVTKFNSGSGAKFLLLLPLAFRRECILTAFSLTPREDLFKQIEDLAQHSGFKKDTKSEDMEIDNFDLKNINHTEFEGLCQDFIESLQKGFGTASTKLRVNSVLVEKKERNLEGLISIQGKCDDKSWNFILFQAKLIKIKSYKGCM